MIKVKICGITNFNDASDAVRAGCDALGFIFYRESPRYIPPEKAADITSRIPPGVIKTGVFVNAREKTIRKISKLCNLDILQLHGSESPEFCARLKGYKIIKAFRIKNKIDVRDIEKYKVFAYLFDTYSGSKMGGTGKRFNWRFYSSELAAIKKPIFLSGGLNKKNVLEAIRVIRPQWVDVCSCVEIKPGKKDPKKVKEFIDTVKKSGSSSPKNRRV